MRYKKTELEKSSSVFLSFSLALRATAQGKRRASPTPCGLRGLTRSEYSGQKKPLVRNGGNGNTDFKETILIVLFFAQFRMLGPRGILNHVRASHSQTSIFECEMQVLSSQKQITKCESTAFSGTRFPFDRYAGFHYSGFTVYFAPVYSRSR